jgi:transcriptional regulator
VGELVLSRRHGDRYIPAAFCSRETTMYLPPYFEESDRETLYGVIRDNNFGLLITVVDGAPFVTHLPFLLEGDRLVAHMARANPQWRTFGAGEALCVFQGPHAYVSPRWYAGTRLVPTWNYVAVHVYGTPRIVEEPSAVRDQQARLVAAHEAGAAKSWTMDGLPESHLAGQLRAIVAFEIPITRIEGKFKLNQNRTPEDRAGVIAALGQSAHPGDKEMAALMTAREGRAGRSG